MKQQKQSEIVRINRRKADTIDRHVRRHRITKRRSLPYVADTLRVIPLGGQNGIGEKNMIVVEYGNDAVVLDCGFDLGIDLPGINYAIPATEYLQSIKHKLRGYIISHGHMDHIGGLIHIVPDCPAPVFGSQFTIGMVQAQFEKSNENEHSFVPDTRVMNMDAHERIQLGAMTIELVRVTHSIPESSAIVVDTPVGRIINTGDFRLDPEPLDTLPSDIARLKQLGDEGVLLLMSESTNATSMGRTPTEHTLQRSFQDLIANAKGRIFVSIFSTNMNRIQMIINAAHDNGRKVALDGRSMMATAELAVRLGNLKIPKGTLITMRETASIPDPQLIIICTGGQGEPGAAMSRMAVGEHQYIKLKKGDSVIISSTPIPGNERSYQRIGDDLATIGVVQFRHPTHLIDGAGPLHVSGHGNRDEHAEMIQLTKPKYLMPIYGGALNRYYHHQIGSENGLESSRIIMVENGEVVQVGVNKPAKTIGKVASGALLVDQTGSVVSEIVTKDRLMLRDDGFIVVMMTLDMWTGRLLSSPDIITRGLVAVRDNAEMIDSIRAEIRRQAASHRQLRTSLDMLKQSIRDTAAQHVYHATGHTPITVVVVNIVGAHGQTNIIPRPSAEVHS
jgi:ribonuclease J